jgi:hypothetical protein
LPLVVSLPAPWFEKTELFDYRSQADAFDW